MTRVSLIALMVLLAGPVAAQQAQVEIEDLRPEEWRYDNLTLEELPIPVAPTMPDLQPEDDGNAAAEVSGEVFGPRLGKDEAYGAYQRGYFLTALALALPRAEKGDAAAQTLIGTIYADGLGVRENLATASSWYSLASKNGDMLATFELAMLYQDGSGVPQNRERAAELFTKAADMGSMPAKYNLALLHVEGRYATPDLIKAAALMKEAADSGLPEAQYDYGMMLIDGAGIPTDPVAGAEQLKLAAEAGLPSAQIDYATILYLGKGVPKDRTAAASWYRRAADAGNPVAQNRLAKMTAVGEGVDLNLEDAAMWRALARRQGLTDPVLDDLLVSISADELQLAEERARFWPSAPPTNVADATGQPDIKIVDTRPTTQSP
jgi:TPR repeat protein